MTKGTKGLLRDYEGVGELIGRVVKTRRTRT